MLKSVRYLVQKHGILALVKKGALFAFRRTIYSRQFVQMYVLRRGSRAAIIHPASISPEVCRLCYSDLAGLDFGMPGEDKVVWLRQCKERFEGKHECWGVLLGGQIVSFIWIALNGIVHISEVYQYVIVDDHALYFYDAVTVPQFRGKAFYPYLVAQLCEAFIEKDRWIGAVVRNQASVRGIHKVGFERDIMRYCFCICGFRFKGICR